MFANENIHKASVMQDATNLQAAVGTQPGNVASLVKRIDAAEASRQPGFAPGGVGGGGGPSRFILERKALSGFDILQDGSGFIPWTNKFRKMFDQRRSYGRGALKFQESSKVEEIEKKAKEEMNSSHETIVELYDMLRPSDGMIAAEWKEVNRDFGAALVDMTTGEAVSKVDSSGQGQGLYAYVRLHRWLTASTGMGK